jgi:hypothetical protein
MRVSSAVCLSLGLLPTSFALALHESSGSVATSIGTFAIVCLFMYRTMFYNLRLCSALFCVSTRSPHLRQTETNG